MVNNDSTADESTTDCTAADVLDEIEEALGEKNKFELTNEQMEVLGIWADYAATRQPVIKTAKAVDPVSWALYSVSDVDGRAQNEYLALEIHDKQQGERYTRPYATGLGQPSVESAGAPDLETMRKTVAEVADRRNVEMPENDELASIQGELERADCEYVDIALNEKVWAAAFTGGKLYIEPKVSRWEGFEHLFDHLELTEQQRKVIQEAASEWLDKPRHIDTTASFSFAADIELA
jgi:hypothetical protein